MFAYGSTRRREDGWFTKILCHPWFTKILCHPSVTATLISAAHRPQATVIAKFVKHVGRVLLERARVGGADVVPGHAIRVGASVGTKHANDTRCTNLTVVRVLVRRTKATLAPNFNPYTTQTRQNFCCKRAGTQPPSRRRQAGQSVCHGAPYRARWPWANSS